MAIYVCLSQRAADRPVPSIKYRDSGSVIRWNGIQPAFEDAVADVLIIMDGAYFPSPDVMRKRDGVLELISPTTSAAHMAVLGRASFTHWLSEQLRARAKEGSEPLTICELYERLLSLYSKQHRDFQQAVPETMPMPLHIRAGAARFMPIGLQPVDADSGGARLHKVSHGLKDMRLSINIALNDNEPSNMDSWIEWLRLMPDGVRDVKVDGPYQQPSYR